MLDTCFSQHSIGRSLKIRKFRFKYLFAIHFWHFTHNRNEHNECSIPHIVCGSWDGSGDRYSFYTIISIPCCYLDGAFCCQWRNLYINLGSLSAHIEFHAFCHPVDNCLSTKQNENVIIWAHFCRLHPNRTHFTFLIKFEMLNPFSHAEPFFIQNKLVGWIWSIPSCLNVSANNTMPSCISAVCNRTDSVLNPKRKQKKGNDEPIETNEYKYIGGRNLIS